MYTFTQKLDRSDSIVYCQTCGAINREDAKFCFKCGDKLEKGIEPNRIVIPTDMQPQHSDDKDVEAIELEYIKKSLNSGSGTKNQQCGFRINKDIRERMDTLKNITRLKFDYQVADYLLDFHRRHATPRQLGLYAAYDSIKSNDVATDNE